MTMMIPYGVGKKICSTYFSEQSSFVGNIRGSIQRFSETLFKQYDSCSLCRQHSWLFKVSVQRPFSGSVPILDAWQQEL